MSAKSESSSQRSAPRSSPRLLLVSDYGTSNTSSSNTTFIILAEILGRTFRTSHGDIKALLSSTISFDMILVVKSEQSLSSKDCEILKGALFAGGKLVMFLDERMDEAVLSSVNFYLESFNISVRNHCAPCDSSLGKPRLCNQK